jgi:hypothetical protein
MGKLLRIISLAATAAVVLGGLRLIWQQIPGNEPQGVYAGLAVYLQYVIYFGLLALFGLVIGIIQRNRVAVYGCLSYVLFVGFVYMLDTKIIKWLLRSFL